MKSEALLESRDAGNFLRRLEDAEQRPAEVGVNPAKNETRKCSKCSFWPKEETELDNKLEEHEVEKANDDQQRGRGARSLQLVKRDKTSQMVKTKSTKTSVISNTSSARRVRRNPSAKQISVK